MDNYSLSDIRAVPEGGGAEGFGGGAWWIIILFLFLFGTNGFGGKNDGATAATQQEILYGQQFQGINDRLASIGNGVCDSTFALNNSILNEGRSIQMQLADCCCNTQLAVANLAAQGDRNTCAITTAVHAEGEQTRALIQQNEMQALRDKVSALELNNAMCGVIRYPTATTFGAGMNPFFGGCGCGCSNI